jgi:deazaflavin-dependent oxidoreductase (nitroreductase family)
VTVLARLRALITGLFARLMRRPLMQRHFAPVFPAVHLRLYRWTRGRVNLSAILVPSLVLQTTGAKTGQPRETPLMCRPCPDGSFLVAGSNWAQEHHPAWTANLLAHPRAHVVFGRKRLAVTAQLLAGDEREAAWTEMEAQWPGYRRYEETSGRQIRIFRLVPAG